MYVAHLASTTTEDDLSHLCDLYGSVERVRIIRDRETGRARGFAFVDRPNGPEARAAMAGLHGTSLGERTLTVPAARPREGEQRGNAIAVGILRRAKACSRQGKPETLGVGEIL
jgi:cold-inducible RNA-binding protein